MTINENNQNGTQNLGPQKKYPNFHFSMIFIFLFMISYCVFGIWLLFDGWINKFSSLYWLWSINPNIGLPPIYSLALMSLIGSILGCGTLDIVSFHKYVAIEKCYDLDHIWGYLISPVLAAIVGLLIFSLFQSGLLIFSGGFNAESTPVTASLGFTAIGFVAGYSWPEAVKKFKDVSKSLFSSKKINSGKTQSERNSALPTNPTESKSTNT